MVRCFIILVVLSVSRLVLSQEGEIDGRTFYFQQEYAKAIPLLEVEYTADSSVRTAEYLLSASYLSGLYTRCKEVACSLLLKDSMNIQANLRMAQLKEKEGQSQEAAKYLMRLVVARPDHAYFHKLYGLNYLKQHDDIQAFQWLSKAYSLAPEDVELIVNLADLFSKQKQYNEADQLVTRGLELFPEHKKLQIMQAEVCYSDRYYEHTVRLLEEMRAKENLNNYLRRMLAACYIQSEEFDAGLKILKEIEDPDNNEEYTYLYLHKAYSGLGDLILARHYIEKCIEACKHPNAGKYYGFLGNVLIETGMYTQAAENYLKAAMDTGDAQLLYLAARAYDASESYRNAQIYYRVFVNRSAEVEGLEEEKEFANNRIEKLKEY